VPERAVSVERWRALGRFLPRDVRERVFEPAFGDLTYHWLSSDGARRLPFGIHALSTYLGCFPVVIPRLFVKGGRLTGLGRASVWTVAVLATVMLVVANFTQSYASYEPQG
jgi:hypothetical protein